jgi:hypothetical protein
MGIQTATLLEGGTLAASAGTERTLAPITTGPGSAQMFVSSDTSMLTRRVISATTKQPKRIPTATGTAASYTQARSKLVIKYPKTLANDYVTVNTLTIELSTDVETTAAEKLELRKVAAQTLFDADFTSFWDNLSTV